jgi:hypothetical protein
VSYRVIHFTDHGLVEVGDYETLLEALGSARTRSGWANRRAMQSNVVAVWNELGDIEAIVYGAGVIAPRPHRLKPLSDEEWQAIAKSKGELP